MYQVYFLSVSLCLLEGLFLVSLHYRRSFLKNYQNIFKRSYAKLILSVLGFITGILTLFFVPSGQMPIIGNFLVAAVLLAMSIFILMDVSQTYQKKWIHKDKNDSQGVHPSPNKLKSFFMHHYLGLVGILGLIIGVVHFLFPQILFL